jgi:predicted regulator of amino acid metabolism with ACT domain
MDVSSADAQIETLKELWLTDSDLSFLRELEPSLLARVTAEVKAHSERSEASQRPLYETMAKATRFIPNFVLQKLSGNLPPYVQARVTEHLEPKAAAALAKHMPASMLAEIALHLDSGLVAAVAAHQDLDTLTEITNLISKKGLARKLGEISDALDERMLEKLIKRIGDPEQLASVAAHMTATTKLANIAGRLDKPLLQAVVSLLETRGFAHTAAALAR